ncbi:MAG: class I SAM-dependent methyltransferase, partial [Thermanaerothrix sp.]|nr:class I SAM-dependent methyltransferase [Thermanaerothrix sp.]
RYQADLICCRQTLEHLYRPSEFVTMLRRSIGERKTIAFFEVPNVLFMLRALSVWDVIYEHYSYFSSGSLIYLFSACGFKVLSVEDSYEDQYLIMDVEPSSEELSPKLPESNELSQLYEDVQVFQKHFQNKAAFWQQQLGHLKAEGKRVVVWGAGSKGVTFLNALGIKNEIEYVVDINPRKTGMHVAGSGQRIVDPSFLRGYYPDVILIMNPIYESEIREQVRSLGLETEFLLV